MTSELNHERLVGMTDLIHYAPCVRNPFSKTWPVTVDPTKVTCPLCRSIADIKTPGPSLAEETSAPSAVRLEDSLVHWSRTLLPFSLLDKTDDPTKVTCAQCRRGPAFAEALQDETSRQALMSDLRERSRLQRAVTRAQQRADGAETELKRTALFLAERVDALKTAQEALRKYTEEGAVSPSGSTESTEQAVPVPEAGPKFPKAAQGLQSFNVTFDGVEAKFISDLSIPRMTDWPNRDTPCDCALCPGMGYRQYKPGPF